ncbi:hypothetical protein BT96DRAFT_939475 [Gymnopus androsaceus JB14]|uniref:Uncharacterized protein n=1 Tax=Gymnopus androsaceus JB14 TaxID=1447944 RepID=A0A6A4HNT0_9AGAR|nr:hypothetical protein BT96DRAFT_939475 [Gymnopus androsaceus JB14]
MVYTSFSAIRVTATLMLLALGALHIVDAAVIPTTAPRSSLAALPTAAAQPALGLHSDGASLPHNSAEGRSDIHERSILKIAEDVGKDIVKLGEKVHIHHHHHGNSTR